MQCFFTFVKSPSHTQQKNRKREVCACDSFQLFGQTFLLRKTDICLGDGEGPFSMKDCERGGLVIAIPFSIIPLALIEDVVTAVINTIYPLLYNLHSILGGNVNTTAHKFLETLTKKPIEINIIRVASSPHFIHLTITQQFILHKDIALCIPLI